MVASVGQTETESCAVEFTSAIFPEVEERFGIKVLAPAVTGGAITSGAGNGLPTLPFDAY